MKLRMFNNLKEGAQNHQRLTMAVLKRKIKCQNLYSWGLAARAKFQITRKRNRRRYWMKRVQIINRLTSHLNQIKMKRNEKNGVPRWISYSTFQEKKIPRIIRGKSLIIIVSQQETLRHRNDQITFLPYHNRLYI